MRQVDVHMVRFIQIFIGIIVLGIAIPGQATDFTLIAKPVTAYVLPTWNEISLEDAAVSVEEILWQIDFSMLIDNVTPGEVGFGYVEFDVDLANTADSMNAGWNSNQLCGDGIFLTCLYFVNSDRGGDLQDLKELYVEVGGTYYPPPLGPRRFPLTGGPWLLGSLFLTDVLGKNSIVSVNNIEFTAMLSDRSFSTFHQQAYGQNIMYLPRSPVGASNIFVSTAVPEPYGSVLFTLVAMGGIFVRGRR
jgi:hypothetical protein